MVEDRSRVVDTSAYDVSDGSLYDPPELKSETGALIFHQAP